MVIQLNPLISYSVNRKFVLIARHIKNPNQLHYITYINALLIAICLIAISAYWQHYFLKIYAEPAEIYNADETGFYYRAIPDGSQVFKSCKLDGPKISKDRLTLLVCASMTGERCPLMVIGNPKNPRCFRGIGALPIAYHSNKNAWMTSAIFEEWLHKWDRELIVKKRKIALILDNCPARPKLELRNIKLVFLPPNVTSLIQPCDQGIIRALKQHYRRMLVMKLLSFIESSNKPMSAVLLARKLDMLTAFHLVQNAWTSISSVTIVNCFRKAKFYEATHPSEPHCSEPEQNMVNPTSALDFDFEKFVAIDDDIPCFGPIQDDLLIKNVMTKKDESESEESSFEENETSFKNITSNQAMESLKALQLFLTENKTEDYRNYNLLERQIQSIILSKKSNAPQRSLMEWFNKK